MSRIEGIAGSPSYMSPEQVQSEELTPRSDLYSLGAVMYELLTGFRPFRADNLSKLLHQIVYATPPPIHTYRDDLPEELEHVVMTTMQKDPNKRPHRRAMAAELTRVYKDLRQKYDSLDNQEHFDLLRTLTFFHEFSHAEIWEVLRASDWHEYKDGEDIVARARSTTASTSSCRARLRSIQRHHDRHAGERRVFRRDQLRARRQAPGIDQGRRCR